MIPCPERVGDVVCGRPARRWQNFTGCDQHSPAARRGATVPAPDPDLTMDGIRRRWYADQDLDYVPPSSTLSSSAAIDERNVTAGKKRASDAAVRQARQALTDRRTR